MNTEIADTKSFKGWVLFDAECPFCTRQAHRFGPLLRRYQFKVASLQTPWIKQKLQLGEEELLSKMRLLTFTGEIYAGADALWAIARQIWWARPLYSLSRVTLLKTVVEKAYRLIARKRNCLRGYSCRRERSKRVFFEMP